MKLYPYLFFVLLTCGAWAQIQMVWSGHNSGGGRSSSQNLSLDASIGQPVAGVSLAGDLVLNAGYQPGTRGCGVNLTDLVIICQAWLTADPALNLSGQAQITLDDFAILAAHWLEDCPAGWPVK